MANIGSCNTIAGTPGATVTITFDNTFTQTIVSWTAGETETVNLSGTQKAGMFLILMITNDALARTITLGTGMTSTGVIVGTALKTAIVVMLSNGTTFYELSRTLGL